MMARDLGWTLVQFVWQGTLLALAFALVRWWIGARWSPAGRYRLASATLVAMAAAPVITFFAGPWEHRPVSAWPLQSADAWEPLLPWLSYGWLAGTGVFSLRLVRGWQATARLRRLGVEVVPEEWLARLQALAARMEVRIRVEFLVTTQMLAPATIGWVRPVVFLPATMLTGLPAVQIEALIAHELAHVKRFDYLVNILQNVAEAMLFYHPAVWWVSAQIRRERELACDDQAAAACGDRMVFAQALAEMETHRQAQLALAATDGPLLERIRRLVEPPRASETAGIPAAIAIGAMSLVGISTLMAQPRVVEVAQVRQAPASPVTLSPVGPARQDREPVKLQGRLVDDMPGQPVTRGRIALTGPAVKDPVPVLTDGNGGFTFPNLLPGRYRVTVDTPGFFPETYPEFTVEDKDVKLSDMVATRKRSLLGTVRWVDGEPAVGATVVAVSLRGDRYTATVRYTGEFEIKNVPPNRYMVFAFAANAASSDIAPRLAAPTFYPTGRTAPDSTLYADLRTPAELRGVSLVLDDQPAATIEGTVTSTVLAPGTAVNVQLLARGLQTGPLMSVAAKVGETFRIASVPAGEYVVAAANGNGNAAAVAARLGLGRAVGSSGDPSTDLFPITVRSGQGRLTLNVAVTEPAVLPGKAEVEEDDLDKRTVKRSPAPPMKLPFAAEAVPIYDPGFGVDGKGEYRRLGVARGELFKLSADVVPSCECYIARMTQGDKDLLAGALPVVGGGEPFLLTLRKDGGRVEGKVTVDGKAPSRAMVVLAPRDRKMTQWYRRVASGPDGTFRIANVAPGEYDLFSWDRDDDSIVVNPAFLDRYAADAVRVKVEANSTRSVNVKMGRLQ